MTKKITYTPQGVCCRMIEVESHEGVIKSVKFIGGCDGNLKGISSLVVGEKIEDVAKKLRGIDCRGRGTSCPDQLSKALTQN